MSEERIIILEQHAKGTDATLGRVENKIDTIVETLNSLVRIEERQSVINIRLNEGAQTMQNHESRIQAIETRLPGLIEKAGWLVAGVLGIIAIVGAAAAKVIFK
jgi:hypothetical protein